MAGISLTVIVLGIFCIFTYKHNIMLVIPNNKYAKALIFLNRVILSAFAHVE
jgi:hypothetical protein